MTFGLHVPDDGLDGGAAAQLAFDDTEDAALLAGDEDATGILCVVTAVSLVDLGALDHAAGEFLGVFDDGREGMSVVWVAWQRLGVPHELTARARALVVTIETLTPNS